MPHVVYLVCYTYLQLSRASKDADNKVIFNHRFQIPFARWG